MTTVPVVGVEQQSSNSRKYSYKSYKNSMQLELV